MQREMFQPRRLELKAKDGLREPRLWFRRFVLWPEPGAQPIQDLAFGPGLNIIWSPDPTDRSVNDRDQPPPGPGHGAGKTLVCRLLRYCLGEPNFASDILRRKISGAFKEGRVGAEVVVDGQLWAVVRSIGVFGHDVVMKGGTLEVAAAADAGVTGMEAFVEMLADDFITPGVASLVGDSPQRAWLLAVACLSRDQECHFGRLTDWRVAGGNSGSPAQGLSVGNATNVVRAFIGAVSPTELELEEKISRLQRQRDEAARIAERRRWLIENALSRLLKELELGRQDVPHGDLLVPFLSKVVRKHVAMVAIVDPEGELASVGDLEHLADKAEQEVARLETETVRNEANARVAALAARLIESESPGLAASIDDAAAPICPICEVPIDRALAEGCKLSHKLPDLAWLHERRKHNVKELRERKAEEEEARAAVEDLHAKLEVAKEKRDQARKAVNAARKLQDRRTDGWYAVRRLRDDLDNLESLLREEGLSETSVGDLDEELTELKSAIVVEREQHTAVLARLAAHFDPIVRRLLGRAPTASGRVKHDGNGLQLVVDFGGERNTPAIDLVKVLAFDLATLCCSIEGTTKLPPLLIHDSPRTSDLGLSIYHELFHLVCELEGVGPTPLFQYFVTTTSRPPDELVGGERVRLKLKGAPAEERLLGRDL